MSKQEQCIVSKYDLFWSQHNSLRECSRISLCLSNDMQNYAKETIQNLNVILLKRLVYFDRSIFVT